MALSGESEDCLYLNFWLPTSSAAGDTHAVMLFLYGGSWVLGSAMFPVYDGEHLARHGVIAVACNYRLGAFGFLGSDALRATDGSTGNFGLQDQRMALQWIHRNAVALGADRSRVMLFGESAGAGSVSNHLVHPRSWGLFSRAGMESGPFADWSSVTLAVAESRTAALARDVGCSNASRALLAGCLRNVSATSILAAQHGLPAIPPTDALSWAPVVDGVELRDTVRSLGARGQIAPNVSVLLGTNRDEGTEFNRLPTSVNATALAAYLATVAPDFGGANGTAAILAQYAAPRFKPTWLPRASADWWRFTRLFGDMQMTCAARRSARQILDAAAQGGSGARVYVYFFTRELDAVRVAEVKKGRPMGVMHASELVFVFDISPALLAKAERTLAASMGAYWTSFAKQGAPVGGAGDPSWPAYEAHSDQVLVLDAPIKVQSGLKRADCDFWDAFDVYMQSQR